MTYTKEQFLETYKKLPEEIKEAISQIDSVTILKKVGQKYSLHIDQLGQLSDEIGLVMIGLNKSQDFTSNIQKTLNLSPNQADNISVDINTAIFLPIRESLKKLEDGKGGELNREEILAGVENPAPASATSGLFEEKMGKMFNLPRQEKTVVAEESAPVEKVVDPYQEPI